MSDDFIPPSLIPHGVNDERSRTMIKIASDQFDGFDNHDLLFLDALTVDAKFLPAMAVARTMSDFILPGMREVHVRRLLDDYRAIHEQTGYVAGTRRALRAIGVEIEWDYWWQDEPKRHHNTHIVRASAEDVIFEDDDNLIGDRTIDAVRRFIHLTQRWSQDIEFEILLATRTSLHVGAFTTFTTELNVLPFVANIDPADAAMLMGAAPTFNSLLTVQPRQ